jgi:hypothetical protein
MPDQAKPAKLRSPEYMHMSHHLLIYFKHLCQLIKFVREQMATESFSQKGFRLTMATASDIDEARNSTFLYGMEYMGHIA